MATNLGVVWLDRGRTAKCKPNPDYPDGKDVDISASAEKTCEASLPYPAPRCGIHLLICEECGLRVGVTAAGRVDDPRTAKVACLNQPRKN